MAEVRTRFAPSPTGYMHIGNLRTALYTYLIAKKNNGKFILRIEDTDQNRYVKGAVDVIYKTLKACGIEWDEGPDIGGDYGPYIQSERKGIYMEYAKQLIEKKKAYYCFCSQERLEKLRLDAEKKKKAFKYDGHCLGLKEEEIKEKLKKGEKFVIRQKMPREGSTTFHDEVFGDITVNNEELDDQILIKSDGLPTYNFANVVDDHLMKITHIVRGSEYLSSTPKYNLLYEAFGWEIPTYIHVSPIMKSKEKKLSKREGDASFSDFYEKGYLEEAIVNYIALLGWSPRGEKEIFSMQELIEAFSVEGISKSPAIFDLQKLNWVNLQYIKKADIDKLFKMALPHLKKAGYVGDELSKEEAVWIKRLVDIHREKMDYIGQLPKLTAVFFKEEVELENDDAKKVLKGDSVRAVLESFLKEVEKVEDMGEDFPRKSIKKIQKETGIRGKALFMPIRVALTGQMHGPDIYATVLLLGREKVKRRLQDVLKKNMTS